MLKDLTGQRIGKWTVLSRAENHVSKSGTPYTMWLCKCDCGTEKTVYANSLLNGKSISCGCYQADRAKEVCSNNFRTHGGSKERLYKIWTYIKKRCYSENAINYKDYGGRGIKVCDEWREDYTAFRDWSLENGYDDSLSIDRINVDGDYEPENCRWVDSKAQNNNRRSNHRISYNGETHTIAEWADITGISPNQLYKKIGNGKTLEEILSA